MPAMQRDEALERIGRDAVWDLLVVGGGATGLGVAVDAASRGYQTLLLEQDDFCKGTSSRSTKLIHGGVRYLAQGEVRLVRGALRERGLLLANAPHLVQPLWLVLPVYRWWEGPYYWAGLKAYDLLSGRWSLGRSAWLSRRRVLDRLPGLRREGLRGGVRFLDAQFDDARLGLCLARTADRQGAALANYVRVTGLLREQSRVAGVEAVDEETGRSFRVQARVVVNATGVFADALRKREDPEAEPVLRPSQGAHLVVGESLLPAGDALIVPRTEEEWERVRNAGFVIAESGNLLMMEGRALDEPGWMPMSQALVDIGRTAIAAAETKDPQAVFDAGAEVYYVCTNCHASFALETLRPSDERAR